MGSTCQTSGESEAGSCCGTGAARGGSSIRCPGCGEASCSDPVACGASMWTCSFFAAMKAAQVEVLKTKIQKAWGPMMDKAADAALESMGSVWQSILAQTKAKEEFRAKLHKLWQEGK